MLNKKKLAAPISRSKRVPLKTLCAGASLIALSSIHRPAVAQEATPVPPIDVTAPATTAPAQGSEAAGYKPETTTNFGPFGQLPILDVPYSVNVISAPLIENKMITDPNDVFRISPVVQEQTPDVRNQYTFGLRGFFYSTVSEDGLRYPGGNGLPTMTMEDKERVEIYTGLTGFLFGPTNVGGMVNFVNKRPTNKPLADITIGDYGNLAGYAHGDFGGPLAIPGVSDGMFAYRLNLVEEHGDLPIDPMTENKQLVSGVLDWHIAPNTTLEFLGRYLNSDLNPADTQWTISSNPATTGAAFNYSVVPNPAKVFGPLYAGNQLYSTTHFENERLEVNLTSKLNDIFTARLAYAYLNQYQYGGITANNTLSATGDTGTYTTSTFRYNGVNYQYNSA